MAFVRPSDPVVNYRFNVTLDGSALVCKSVNVRPMVLKTRKYNSMGSRFSSFVIPDGFDQGSVTCDTAWIDDSVWTGFQDEIVSEYHSGIKKFDAEVQVLDACGEDRATYHYWGCTLTEIGEITLDASTSGVCLAKITFLYEGFGT